MPTEWPQLDYSLSEVKKAGKILRRAHLSVLEVTEDEAAWADAVLNNWRRAHAEAENWAQMGLRSRLRTIGVEGAVTQRRKERPTIIRKILREYPRVQLSTMEDIAGARAVVPSLGDLRRLQEQWEKTGGDYIFRRRDKITDPPASGYRAVHLVMKHRGRLVEVQLRTTLQQLWADLVEDIGKRVGTALKNEEGPADVLGTLSELGDVLAEIDGDYGPRDPRIIQQARDIIGGLQSRLGPEGQGA